jgi:hypothetical protein
LLDLTIFFVRIGERLATASAQRESVDAALEVMNYFAELNTGDAQSSVFVDPEKIHEREALLKNLQLVTSGLSDKDEKTKVGVAMVESQCRLLEKQLLERFRTAIRAGDIRSMQVFAQSLFDFDGGVSCIDTYLQEAFAQAASLRVFSERDRVTHDAASVALRKFFMQVTNALDRHQATIEAVFPDPVAVLTTIVEKIFDAGVDGNHDESEPPTPRVAAATASAPLLSSVSPSTPTKAAQHNSIVKAAPFQLSVRGFLERVRAATETVAPELYLNLLAEAYDRTLSLVERLSKFSFDPSVNLQRMMDNVFSPSRDTYIQKELALLTQTFTARMATFRGLLSISALEEQKNSARFVWQEIAFDLQKTQDTSVEDMELAKFFFHQSKASMERCMKLSHQKDVPQNVTNLYKMLIRKLGSECVDAALDLHLSMIPDKPNPKKQLNVTFLYVVLTVNSIVLDLELFHHSVVLPKVSVSINEPTKCAAMKNKLLAILEQKLSSGMVRIVQVMAAQAEAILTSKQRRNDYRNEDAAFTGKPTAACEATCEFLDAQHAVAVSCLDGGNAEAFFRTFGRLFYDALFAHMKRHSVSMGVGGTQLMIDISRYADSIRKFKIPALDTQFANLRTLANIHLVEEANIKTLLKDLQGSIPRGDLMAYLSTHELYRSNWNNEMFG